MNYDLLLLIKKPLFRRKRGQGSSNHLVSARFPAPILMMKVSVGSEPFWV